MKDSEILKKRKDFRSVYTQGRSRSNRYLVMYIKENGTARNRIGICVSKKIGNSVQRHHLTRLIRESYRSLENEFLKGYDIVVVARIRAKEKKFHEIKEALIQLEKLHGIWIKLCERKNSAGLATK